MKSRSMIKAKSVEPRVMLHGRILYRDQEGEIRDVTHEDIWGLKKFAEDGELALHILDQVRKRLDLLYMAAEHRSQMDAGLVRLAIEDVRTDLEDGSELRGYVQLTQELFKHSQALPPLPTPDARNAGRSLTIVKPTS